MLFDKFRRQFDSDTVLVETPDHPVLVSPPDALIARKGKILAIYKPHKTEIYRPKNLLSRLVLSRFALPIHTLHTLVLDTELDTKPISKTASFFDETILLSELRSCPTLLNSNIENRVIERASIGRKEHYFKYNILFDLSLKQIKTEPEEKRSFNLNKSELEKAHYCDWLNTANSKQSLESRFFYKHYQAYITMPEFDKTKQRLDLLRSICLSSLQLDAEYSNGIYQSSLSERKMILTDSFPSYKHDKLKALRSASFAGLSLSHAKNDESLERYVEFQNNRIDRDWHEYIKKENRNIKRNRNW